MILFLEQRNINGILGTVSKMTWDKICVAKEMRVINFTAGTEGNPRISDISELGTVRVNIEQLANCLHDKFAQISILLQFLVRKPVVYIPEIWRN